MTRRIATVLVVVLAGAIGAGVADAGEHAAPTPACFGAAARDPQVPCVNDALNRTAIPSPYAAPLEPSEPCERIDRASPPACAFGGPRRTARTSVALLGDSHATHWRAALAFLARRRQWHGVSIDRNLCPFTLARTNHHDRCKGWTRGVLRWLRGHPEVTAAFVSANAGSGIQDVPGQRRHDTKVDGYLRAWSAMPASVREIFVLRDVPHSAAGTAACVSAALARHRNPARRCARPRDQALVHDVEADAAALDRSGRVRLVDLTALMCDDQNCLPVIGGALVIKDIGHMTRTFSRTLGPFLGRAVDGLRGHGGRAAVAARSAGAARGPIGALTQLPGAKGCFVDPASSVAVNGCTPTAALQSPQTVVLSPDERFAYTPSNFSNAITAFARSPGGELSRLGCVSSVTPGCQAAVDTVHAFAVAMSPDGRSLYLTTTAPTNTLDQFTRDPATGAVAQLAGTDACLGVGVGCTQTPNLRQPRGLVISPDGRFAYVVAFSGDDVVVLSRDRATSRLTPLSCIRQGAATKTCRGGAHNLDGATDVDLSADGRSLYVTSYRGDAITAFARDPDSGALTEAGCWAEGATGGCTSARGLDGAYDVAISADGRSVYVAARRSSAIATFARDGATGVLTQLGGENGCISQAGVDGCRPSTSASLLGARGVAVSPDGRNVYAGAFSSSALSIMRRKATTGALRQLSGTRGCVANREPSRPRACAVGRGLHHVWGIAISRDGRWLYTGDGGDRNSGLAVFRRTAAG